jgi:hypothetical protein
MSETNVEGKAHHATTSTLLLSDRTFVANQQWMIEHRESGGVLQTNNQRERR